MLAQLILDVSSVIFPVFNYNVALKFLERLLAQSTMQEYVPIIRYKKRNIVPLFSAINAIGLPFDSDGKSTVKLPIENIVHMGLGSLEALPLYIDDEGHSYIVPDSITSFEPIVAPLIPIAMYMDGKFIIRLTTPFMNDIKLSYTGMLVNAYIIFDDKLVQQLNWDKKEGLWINLNNLKDLSVIRLQVDEIHVGKGCLFGIALLIPYTAEMPIYVNPRALLYFQTPPPEAPTVPGAPQNLIHGKDVPTKAPDFFLSVLKGLNIPASEFAVQALVKWARCENTMAYWNPLATTKKMKGSWDFNNAGVQNYPDLDTGVMATVLTLKQGYYKAILEMLALKRFDKEGIHDSLKAWTVGPNAPEEDFQGTYGPRLIEEWEQLWDATTVSSARES